MHLRALALAISLALAGTSASAQDKIKVAIGQIDAWANQIPTLGMQAGIFQKHGSSWRISARRARAKPCRR